jgi:hypothetical protein
LVEPLVDEAPFSGAGLELQRGLVDGDRVVVTSEAVHQVGASGA